MTTNAKPQRKGLAANLMSGLATSLFNVPTGLAYAQLAGVNPVYGLCAGIVPVLVAALHRLVLMIGTLTSARPRRAEDEMLKRIGRILAIVVSVLVILLNIGGILGGWWVNGIAWTSR
jgi:hypothetical protein